MKISKQSLEEQAANYLREQILAGDYRSGDKLVESSLAKTLDLSRTTVRMALNTLASEGLISQKPYAGWQVITMDDNDLWEIYHLRCPGEPGSENGSRAYHPGET
ncbi:GntR family transcriptional regulator [Kistimonas asteriae]|uniref:GntR family transcriptional regulator n=1 Tax=Kistimonas asteriae TaxID=517724 RepID=UPI001BAB2530|nr:GntR family transcriptional regulator [Kistimonas asteriae]